MNRAHPTRKQPLSGALIAMFWTSLLCAPAMAADQPADSSTMAPSTQGGAVTVGSFVTGALAGGPIGAVVGLVAGSWLGDKVETAAHSDEITRQAASLQQQHSSQSKQLAAAERQLEQLTAELARARQASAEYARIIVDELQIELLFRTGDSALAADSRARLDQLARFLVDNPGLQVHLEGYADPRGNTDYNQQLSHQRVLWVSAQLELRGVQPERISRYAHGDSQSSARKGDYDAYALERVVKVHIRGDNSQHPQHPQQGLVQQALPPTNDRPRITPVLPAEVRLLRF